LLQIVTEYLNGSNKNSFNENQKNLEEFEQVFFREKFYGQTWLVQIQNNVYSLARTTVGKLKHWKKRLFNLLPFILDKNGAKTLSIKTLSLTTVGKKAFCR
jgi:hypothetical protein